MVVWMTGLSGAGKTTLGRELKLRLDRIGRRAILLDGDELRQTISSDLGFSKADRDEHVRRVAALARDAALAGDVAIVALISPYRAARAAARALVSTHAPFVEIFLECPLDELARRDPKGLYRRAAKGEIASFTGISDPYEAPDRPDMRFNTATMSVDEMARAVMEHVRGLLQRRAS